jgi:ubiquinone biosynthesis protein
MPITQIGKGYRHLKRFRQIVAVLLKYGFGHILSHIKVSQYLLRSQSLTIRGLKEVVELSTPERLRMALEELGPTFIKLGQVLSMRPFLVPPEFVSQLSKLQDEVSPVDYQQIKEVVCKELGQEPEQLFSQFRTKPLASASLAQVHRGTTLDGQEVIVKVRRPGVQRIIIQDLSILRDLASLLVKHLPESRRYDPVGIVDELERTTRREVDFTNEARNTEIFAHNFEGFEKVHVPKVYWKLSTSRVLTTELVDGVKISQLERFAEYDLDRRAIARTGGRILFKQVFEDGFFHADPHPGNLFVLPGNVIAPVDYGMMGRLSQEMITQLSELLLAMFHQDIDELARLYLEMGLVEEDIDLIGFKLDLTDLIDKYTGLPLKRIDMRGVMEDLFQISQRYQFRMRSEYMMLARALSTYEEVGRLLDAEYNFLEEAEPFVQDMLKQRYHPQRILRELVKTGRDLYRLLGIFPQEMSSILKKIRQGELALEFQHRGLDHLINELDRSSNRLAFSLIIAALIVGSSMIMRLEVGPFLFGYSVIGIAGYSIAGLLGLWLAIAILRSGRL